MSPRVDGTTSALASRRSTGPAQFRPTTRLPVPVKEPSDVVALPGGAMLVVSDLSDKIALVRPDGSHLKVKLEGVKDGKSGLEAAAYDPRTRSLFVVSEEKGQLLRFKLDLEKGKAKLEEKIPLLADGNKGVEGLTFLPGDRSPTGRPQLVVAKEGKPRALFLLDADGSGKLHPIKLDPALEKACKDFAALAVDPLSGHLFVGSQESATAAEVTLVRGRHGLEARLLSRTALTDAKGKPLERCEGLTFDAFGNLHALLEDGRELCRYQRL